MRVTRSFRTLRSWQAIGILAWCLAPGSSRAAVNVLLTEVPDYTWDAGCFGTASGNLMGYWDRHGFPNFYTGPTGDGVAPLNSIGANVGIRSLWASRIGLDGRPETQFGHMDDYWVEYESTAPDPYVVVGREEHARDCIGDFIGLNQNKWRNLNQECDGNIDGFSFVFWDLEGGKRVNFIPSSNDGGVVPDIPSGLKEWTRFRGSEADVFSQLADFNPAVTSGQGFTFEDLRAEIDSGYPVLLFLQHFDQPSRELSGMPKGNPEIHGMLAHGYYIADDGKQFVRYKTSWGSSGDNTMSLWDRIPWQAFLPVRGVIGYHPRPKITRVTPAEGAVTIEWEGPGSNVSNLVAGTTLPVHWYVLEKATLLNPGNFEAVTEPTTERSITVPDCCPERAGFFRIRLLPPGGGD